MARASLGESPESDAWFVLQPFTNSETAIETPQAKL